MARWAKRAGIAIVVLLIATQFVPVDRTNPPVDPAKTIYATGIVSDGMHAVFRRSCQDCHSNETNWRWYSKVAPVSWLIASDVHKGRRELNLSEWSAYPDKRKDHKLDSICEQVQRGEMPDSMYALIHPSAKMNETERAAVCKWTEDARKMLSAQQAGTPAH